VAEVNRGGPLRKFLGAYTRGKELLAHGIPRTITMFPEDSRPIATPAPFQDHSAGENPSYQGWRKSGIFHRAATCATCLGWEGVSLGSADKPGENKKAAAFPSFSQDSAGKHPPPHGKASRWRGIWKKPGQPERLQTAPTPPQCGNLGNRGTCSAKTFLIWGRPDLVARLLRGGGGPDNTVPRNVGGTWERAVIPEGGTCQPHQGRGLETGFWYRTRKRRRLQNDTTVLFPGASIWAGARFLGGRHITLGGPWRGAIGDSLGRAVRHSWVPTWESKPGQVGEVQNVAAGQKEEGGFIRQVGDSIWKHGPDFFRPRNREGPVVPSANRGRRLNFNWQTTVEKLDRRPGGTPEFQPGAATRVGARAGCGREGEFGGGLGRRDPKAGPSYSGGGGVYSAIARGRGKMVADRQGRGDFYLSSWGGGHAWLLVKNGPRTFTKTGQLIEEAVFRGRSREEVPWPPTWKLAENKRARLGGVGAIGPAGPTRIGGSAGPRGRAAPGQGRVSLRPPTMRPKESGTPWKRREFGHDQPLGCDTRRLTSRSRTRCGSKKRVAIPANSLGWVIIKTNILDSSGKIEFRQKDDQLEMVPRFRTCDTCVDNQAFGPLHRQKAGRKKGAVSDFPPPSCRHRCPRFLEGDCHGGGGLRQGSWCKNPGRQTAVQKFLPAGGLGRRWPVLVERQPRGDATQRHFRRGGARFRHRHSPRTSSQPCVPKKLPGRSIPPHPGPGFRRHRASGIRHQPKLCELSWGGNGIVVGEGRAPRL